MRESVRGGRGGRYVGGGGEEGGMGGGEAKENEEGGRGRRTRKGARWCTGGVRVSSAQLRLCPEFESH